MEDSFSKPSLVRNRTPKKKKDSSSTSKINSNEDQDVEESTYASNSECKRQIHSKIEKRRRDKMNTYISQLSTMIPSCNSTHKLDKITVLRMAVQYLKSIRSSPMQCKSEENLKYSFITDIELKKLILQVSEGFLLVVGCDSGRILYISESVSTISNCNRNELVGRSLYDVIFPSDINKVKEQISCADLNARHKLIGSKSMKELDLELPSEQLGLHPGNRRSFFFRFKSDVENSGKYPYGVNNVQFYKSMDELASVNRTNYDSQNQLSIIHCVGYLKCWNSSSGIENSKDCDDSSSPTCLIALGRPINNSLQSLQREKPSKFMSKYTVDGKFLFVDHWFTLITGFLPQEVLGTSIYEYIHTEDANEFAETHRTMLQPFNRSNTTKNYRFRTKFENFIIIQSEWKSLQNPWKKDVEYFYSKNVVKWTNNETPSDEKKQNEKKLEYVHNELFSFSNYVSQERDEQNFINDFNFHPTLEDKNANEATMEAILKLLGSDACISD